MTTTPFTTAISRLDDRLLRDIGFPREGGLDEHDPRLRRLPRPVGPVDRMLTLINLPVAGMLFRA